MNDMWIFFAIAAGVIALMVLFGNKRDKRKGVGYYTPYGAMSTKDDRSRIDQGLPHYRSGLHLFLKEKDAEARAQWSEAERYGIHRATTCLGIAAFERYEESQAVGLWSQAARAEEVNAAILLKILGDHDLMDNADGVAAYSRCFVLYEALRDVESAQFLIGTALRYGYAEHAENLRNHLRAQDNRKLSPRLPGWD